MLALQRTLTACALCVCALSACSAYARERVESPPSPRALIIDDRVIGDGDNQFSYQGRWQHVVGYHDGRFEGTSSRSYSPDDSVTLMFTGSRLQLYGIVGPNGAKATLALDGHLRTLNFHASHKRRMLVYESPLLDRGPHSAVIVVGDKPKDVARNGYVNIDYARVQP
jgi:hypothetical protein